MIVYDGASAVTGMTSARSGCNNTRGMVSPFQQRTPKCVFRVWSGRNQGGVALRTSQQWGSWVRSPNHFSFALAAASWTAQGAALQPANTATNFIMYLRLHFFFFFLFFSMPFYPQLFYTKGLFIIETTKWTRRWRISWHQQFINGLDSIFM